MRKPEFVTFTGADDQTDLDEMVALSRAYPIEWGVLFSVKRQGLDPRYPAHPRRFAGLRLRLAAHLCGLYARQVIEGQVGLLPDLRAFERVQVNHPAPDAERIAEFQQSIGRQCIAQTRGAFPPSGRIEWLFDASGGRGVAPTSWPPQPLDNGRAGYAGGIGPGNVRAVLAEIDAARFWIDMESGVRTGDRFDLEKCRRVCEAVFG